MRSLQVDLTKSEAKIAQWLLLNEATLPMETGASLAARTGVSEITVSRFLRRIGFRSMAELKAEIGAPAGGRPLHAPAGGRLGTLLRRDADAILSLGAQIARPEWEDAITALDAADEVFVTGFQTVRGSVRFISAHDGGLVEWVPSRRRDGEARALMLVDMVPYAREAEVVVRTVPGLGMTVMVVTDELNTWAQAHTPFVFHASTKSGAFLESTGPLATLLNLVTHAVAARDPDKVRKRTSAWPVVLRDLGLY